MSNAGDIKEFDVVRMLSEYPPDMIEDGAEQAAAKLTDLELCYLIAAYELRRPRVITRTLSEAVATRDTA
jgi:hypothetical protein